ncbi:MAG: sn-glycerol-1-phosphate dehydrogenase [Clostridia bacterium]|nr:sn-glycerol-1-phosphate dehydrogenase [Clostridia bacterium]
MDINELLKGRAGCACGKNHVCDIERVEIGSGAVNFLPRLCEGYENIVIAADSNTFSVCGARVFELLRDKTEKLHVFEQDGLLIPDEQAIAALSACVSKKTDLIVGVGSGVINDLCKYVSFKKGLPYFIVATAPSMDGYASVGAAMITGNMKTTFSAHVPSVIIGDVDVLREAPMDMIKSGFGDIIGKYSALNDWKLSALVNGEYMCDYVYNLTYETVLKTRALADGIEKRDPETIKTLTEALVIVGIAMAYVGNSRPASGSEHHLSHYFEITGIVKNRGYLLHGIDVVYSTVETQKLREKLLALDKIPENIRAFDRADWEKHIRESYGYAADGVIALQDKLNFYDPAFVSVYREKWNEIRDILREAPTSLQLCEILKTAGMDYNDFERFYGRRVIDDAVLYAKDLKDRYTVLWLYYTVLG